jgi:hypothetical protein
MMLRDWEGVIEIMPGCHTVNGCVNGVEVLMCNDVIIPYHFQLAIKSL